MNTKGIILIGASGHARSCIEVIESVGQYQILGAVGSSQEEAQIESLGGHAVIGIDTDLPLFVKKYQYAFVSVGQIKTPEIRKRLFNQLVELKFEIPSIFSPFSIVSKKSLVKNGTITMHHSIINAGAQVGMNCIINSRALIEHDVIVHDHCHISTGAILNGGVEVGEGTFIGSGVLIKQGVKIGRNCIVEMGAKVFEDLQDGFKFRNF
ncbi:acetyltransferase [Polynucleobacter sphagniphilus]|uniref:acetyltransferase n=1 Tax=Polynucleobacter sphagniphilus TaxID=1743169 RepID=UPI0024735F4A|nr:acetyltransferase [Polynucleobacter sphagniphilus]MDH6525569.1 sugar O-acyltransferase (sialic acid O-acetyltransferase NeuD family) [Polynucleobacter sphagniphilus]